MPYEASLDNRSSPDEDNKVTGWPGSEVGGRDGDQLFINLISAADLSAHPGPCQPHTCDQHGKRLTH